MPGILVKEKKNVLAPSVGPFGRYQGAQVCLANLPNAQTGINAVGAQKTVARKVTSIPRPRPRVGAAHPPQDVSEGVTLGLLRKTIGVYVRVGVRDRVCMLVVLLGSPVSASFSILLLLVASRRISIGVGKAIEDRKDETREKVVAAAARGEECGGQSDGARSERRQEEIAAEGDGPEPRTGRIA